MLSVMYAYCHLYLLSFLLIVTNPYIFRTIILNVVILNVIIVSVVVPFKGPLLPTVKLRYKTLEHLTLASHSSRVQFLVRLGRAKLIGVYAPL